MFLDVFMFIQATVTPLLGQTPEMVLLGLVALAGIEVVFGIMVWAILPDLQRFGHWSVEFCQDVWQDFVDVLEEGTPPEEPSPREPWRDGRIATILPPEVAKRNFHLLKGGR